MPPSLALPRRVRSTSTAQQKHSPLLGFGPCRDPAIGWITITHHVALTCWAAVPCHVSYVQNSETIKLTQFTWTKSPSCPDTSSSQYTSSNHLNLTSPPLINLIPYARWFIQNYSRSLGWGLQAWLERCELCWSLSPPNPNHHSVEHSQ
jgi:hypothetical protein